MRIPDSLASLAEDGIIEEVVRPLMSGKEAQIFLVIAGGQERVAKIYKEAQDRTFKHRGAYTEGRTTRNTRDQRAMNKRSRHGKKQDEAAWRSTEVDMICRLRDAGVRVPVPHQFADGVLIMELITDEEGDPAPRLGDVHLDAEAATAIHARLLRDVVRMLCAGVVHGDLSDFNVLLGADGPVIIDLPQAVEASRNPNARKLLLRDVDNLHRFLVRYVPGAKKLPFAEEMWELYANNKLTPDSELTGKFTATQTLADTHGLMDLIDEAYAEERRRRELRGMSGDGGGRRAPRGGALPAARAPGAAHDSRRPPRHAAPVITVAPPVVRRGSSRPPLPTLPPPSARAPQQPPVSRPVQPSAHAPSSRPPREPHGSRQAPTSRPSREQHPSRPHHAPSDHARGRHVADAPRAQPDHARGRHVADAPRPPQAQHESRPRPQSDNTRGRHVADAPRPPQAQHESRPAPAAASDGGARPRRRRRRGRGGPQAR